LYSLRGTGLLLGGLTHFLKYWSQRKKNSS